MIVCLGNWQTSCRATLFDR